MTNGNGLVGKWKEFSMYSLDHGLIDSPEFREIHQSYTDWYNSDEDDGTKIPREGGSKYLAGIEIYQRMDDTIKMWEGAFNTNKEEVTMDNKKELSQDEVMMAARIAGGIVRDTFNQAVESATKVNIPISTKIIIGSAIVGNATGKGINTVATKVIVPAVTKGVVPAAKATGHYLATDGKDAAVTVGKATKAGWKAFVAGLKNKE